MELPLRRPNMTDHFNSTGQIQQILAELEREFGQNTSTSPPPRPSPSSSSSSSSSPRTSTIPSEFTSFRCVQDCKSLEGGQRERCAIWHQMYALAPNKETFVSCQEFTAFHDICTRMLSGPGLQVVCDASGRVTTLTGVPVISIKPAPGGNPTRTTCKVYWGGTLAPELEVLENLEFLDLSVPPILAYDQDTSQAVDFRGLSAVCDTFEWHGGNVSGEVPKRWGQIPLVIADFSGNQDLKGSVPEAWLNSSWYVRTRGTQLDGPPSCALVCGAPELSGAGRDRCGLWHQLRALHTGEYWLPPCEEFVAHVNICQSHHPTYTPLCNVQGRVTQLALSPVFRDRLGYPVIKNARETGGDACIGEYQGTLAPELGALESLELLDMSPVPPEMYVPGTLEVNRAYLNCSKVEWKGDNLTGAIPQRWDDLGDLQFLMLAGNRYLTGRPPKALQRIDEEVLKYGFFEDTRVQLPRYSALERDKMCKASQRKKGSLVLTEGDQNYIFAINLDKSDVKGLVLRGWEMPSGSSPGLFYCGKNDKALAQVAVLWSLFFVMALGVTALRTWVWRRGRTQSQLPQHRSSTLKASRKGWLSCIVGCWKVNHTYIFALATVYDLLTDLLLAYVMFPSWTTWVVLVGLLLPDFICATAITLQGIPHLEGLLPPLAPYFLAPFFFIITACTFPFLIMLLVFKSMAVAVTGCSPVMGAFWGLLDIDRLAALFTGVTACTEDVFTTVFTTVGFVLMAREPWKLKRTNVYFASWGFWLPMVTSMLHMLHALWEAVGHTLEAGGMGWVGPAFTHLYVGTPVPGPKGQMKNPQGVPGVPEMEGAGECKRLSPQHVEVMRGPPLQRSPHIEEKTKLDDKGESSGMKEVGALDLGPEGNQGDQGALDLGSQGDQGALDLGSQGDQVALNLGSQGVQGAPTRFLDGQAWC